MSKRVKLMQGDVLATMASAPPESFHACLTDPPYGINYMGKEWDAHAPSVEVWRSVYRALKPGAWLACFAHARTMHRMAYHIEEAGFEIRDTIAWLYAKSMGHGPDVGIEVDRALGAEPEIIGTRKLSGNGVPAKYRGKGTEQGAYFVGAASPGITVEVPVKRPSTPQGKAWSDYRTCLKTQYEPIILARKPLQGTYAENALTHDTGGLNIRDLRETVDGRWTGNVVLDVDLGDKSAFFFTSKVNRKERDAGCESLPDSSVLDCTGRDEESEGAHRPHAGVGRAGTAALKNPHPTLKPIELTNWLATMIKPPCDDARLLVPYSGAGSEIIGALQANWATVLGIENEHKYIEVARLRIAHHCPGVVIL